MLELLAYCYLPSPAPPGSGALRPSVTLAHRTRPVVLCTSESWPALGLVGGVRDDLYRTLTMAETHAVCGGLCRIGVTASDLLPWPELVRACELTNAAAAGLVNAARRAGLADPAAAWFGSLASVPRERWRVIETWESGATFEAGRWNPIENRAESPLETA